MFSTISSVCVLRSALLHCDKMGVKSVVVGAALKSRALNNNLQDLSDVIESLETTTVCSGNTATVAVVTTIFCLLFFPTQIFILQPCVFFYPLKILVGMRYQLPL